MFYDEAQGELEASVGKKIHVSPTNGTTEHPPGELRTRCDMAAKILGDCTTDHVTTAESL